MKTKQSIRDFLESPKSLDIISNFLSKRGIKKEDRDFEDTLQEVALEMLNPKRVEYYETKFNNSVVNYAGLIVIQVVGSINRKKGNPTDALDQPNHLYLDESADHEDEEGGTNHDKVSKDALVNTEVPLPVNEIDYYLSSLPPVQAEVFALKYVHGYTHEEIADAKNISVAYSKELVGEAKRELKHLISCEQAYEAQMRLGNTSTRIITNDCSDSGVWNDWSWREEHAEAGPVKHYTQAEIDEYCQSL